MALEQGRFVPEVPIETPKLEFARLGLPELFSKLSAVFKSPRIRNSVLLSALAVVAASSSDYQGEQSGFRSIESPEPVVMADNPQAAINAVLNLLKGDTKNETADLQTQVEQKFGIEVRDARNLYDNPLSSVSGLAWRALGVPDQWDESRLAILESTLVEVPSDLYEPDKGGLKLRIILNSSFAVCGLVGTGDYPRQISIDSLRFNPAFPQEARNILVHEIIHNFTLTTCIDGTFDDRLSEDNSAFFPQVDAILGGEFDEVRKEALEVIVARQAELGDSDGSKPLIFKDQIRNGLDLELYELAHLAYGFKNRAEFLAILGESYFQGKDYFYQMYMRVYPQKVVDSLWVLAKYGFFAAREY